MDEFDEEMDVSSGEDWDTLSSFRNVLETYRSFSNTCLNTGIKVKPSPRGLELFLAFCGYNSDYLNHVENHVGEPSWDFFKREVMGTSCNI